jgi:hypothetical protein
MHELYRFAVFHNSLSSAIFFNHRGEAHILVGVCIDVKSSRTLS